MFPQKSKPNSFVSGFLTRYTDVPHALPRARLLFRLPLSALFIFLLATASFGANNAVAEITILNVSYDPTREFYKEFDVAFAKYWQKETGEIVRTQTSHGGSGKQARAVIDGLGADVVTLALAYDVDAIARKGYITTNWQKRLAENSAPYVSTIVFLVRKGNPKSIKDWNDLARRGIEVVTPNPKTSGGARWNFLAAWGYALQQPQGNEEKARNFVRQVYQNVRVLDSGARGALTTFTERDIGDVLITWENEAYLAAKELGPDKFDIIAPSSSILAEPTVAVIDKNIDRHKTRKVATAYLEYLYSTVGQEIAARHYYRPRNKEIEAKYRKQFNQIKLFTIDSVFGGWDSAQKKFFADGGEFDQLLVRP